jgi:hypothetical protein
VLGWLPINRNCLANFRTAISRYGPRSHSKRNTRPVFDPGRSFTQTGRGGTDEAAFPPTGSSEGFAQGDAVPGGHRTGLAAPNRNPGSEASRKAVAGRGGSVNQHNLQAAQVAREANWPSRSVYPNLMFARLSHPMNRVDEGSWKPQTSLLVKQHAHRDTRLKNEGCVQIPRTSH